VSSHASNGDLHAFLLKVSNPTLGIVRVRVAGSNYAGEPTWDNETTTSSFLQKILVDPLSQLCVDAQLDSGVSSSILETDTCELEAAEDSFLEIGKTSDDVPDAVSKWEGVDIILNSNVSKDSPCSARLVGQKKSVAWFEVVVMEPQLSNPPHSVHSAIPIELQIQVGDGSWESSFIQPQLELEGDSKDFVSFDLVVLWKNLTTER
jgi:hypothetical protein